MSKRTPGLPQRPRGFWPTPKEAVPPLIPFLPPRVKYGEPCAGDGQLVAHLNDLLPESLCVLSSDLEPQADGIMKRDALHLQPYDGRNLSMFITNPPWPRTGGRGGPALPIIAHLITIAPCWALLPFNFAANEYFGQIAASCSDVVPIGRPSWLGNGQGGKDDSAWFRFDALNRHPTVIHARGMAA